MIWSSKTLDEICDIEVGTTPSRTNPEFWDGGTLPWLSIADMNQGRSLRATKESVTEAGAKAARMKIVQPGTLLLSFKLSIGKVGFAEIPLFTNEAIAALTHLRSDVDPHYLYWALRHIDLLQGADRAAMGNTLNKAKLKKIEIPLPPLVEQHRIAAILDKADALRAKRREAIAKLNQLLQSVFLEMFGDPVTNPKGTKFISMGDLTSIRTGKLDANASSEDGAFPFFTCARKPLRISSYSYDCECVLVAGNGDLNVKQYSGKFDAYQRTYIVQSSDKKRLTTNYLYHFLDAYVGELRKQSIGGIIKYIKMGNLTDAPLPLPDAALQVKFNRICDAIAAHRHMLESADAGIRRLFDTAQQRAFSGSL